MPNKWRGIIQREKNLILMIFFSSFWYRAIALIISGRFAVLLFSPFHPLWGSVATLPPVSASLIITQQFKYSGGKDVAPGGLLSGDTPDPVTLGKGYTSCVGLFFCGSDRIF
ncbi:MAG: hypothetical protein QNJ72_07670 [Pleurocapsa sp. MO_226.B13]|nr:hypothetical protein [Pleurocapsa sp. MO_226.B13]